MGYPIRRRQGLAVALVLLAAVGGLARTALAGPEVTQIAFMVSDYRYEPVAGATVNADIGLSLCGTRCNALSGDFASYIKPGGWKMVKTASSIEKRVDLNNPFMAGKCVCIGDEYKVTWYDPATYVDRRDAVKPGTE